MSKQKQLTLDECWARKQKNMDKEIQTDDLLTDHCPWYFFHIKQGSTDIKKGLFRNNITGEILLPGIDKIPKPFWLCMTKEKTTILNKIENMKTEDNETVPDSSASSPIHCWTNDETPSSPIASPNLHMYYGGADEPPEPRYTPAFDWNNWDGNPPYPCYPSER